MKHVLRMALLIAPLPVFAVNDSGRLAVKDATRQTTPGRTAWLLELTNFRLGYA